MPLRVSSDLRFPKGPPTAIGNSAVDEFLALVRKTANGSQFELETFKEYLCRAVGKPYYRSSDASWADTDLERDAITAAEDGPAFLGAIFDACEALKKRGFAVPDELHMNNILGQCNEPFQIKDGELTTSVVGIEYPEIPPDAADNVSKALKDAKQLGSQAGAANSIDRIHTALHAYLMQICKNAGINTETNISTARAFKLLRSQHPDLRPEGPRANEITRILRSLATVIDSISTLRNEASLAHDNLLLEEPEAIVCINAANTVFTYIQNRITNGS